MNGSPFRSFPHTADVGLVVRAKTRRQLFCNAAQGMLSLVTAPPKGPTPPVRKALHLSASDPESLLVRWLNEVLFLLTQRRFFPVDIRFRSLTSKSLSVRIAGRRLPPGHSFTREVKAATFHGLSVRRKNNRWRSAIVFDV